MSKILESLEDFLSFVDDNDKCVVYFGANWCGPCHSLKPKVEKTLVDVPLGYVDIDKSDDIVAEYNVKSIPLVYFFIHGEKFDYTTGADFKAFKEIYDRFIQL